MLFKSQFSEVSEDFIKNSEVKIDKFIIFEPNK